MSNRILSISWERFMSLDFLWRMDLVSAVRCAGVMG